MVSPGEVDELFEAARAVTLTFEGIPEAPACVSSPADLARESPRIVDRFARHGFAILQLEAAAVGPDTLVTLGDELGLGAPFVPPLYRIGRADSPSVTRISAALNLGTDHADHPSFGRTVGQRLHVDGTLQEIGFVKTSMLLCEAPAAEGGDTILFNASAAFAQLVAEDPEAAAALATPGVLVRQANVNGCSDVNVGPAFTVDDGRLVCGYSVTETDSWAVPDGVSETDLRRGVEFMLRASSPGSPHHLQLRLGAGQAILLDNRRISHGRTDYRDSDTQCRCLYRSLHLEAPRPRAQAPAGASSE